MLRPLQGIFTTEDFPALLVGLESPDDAAVYRMNGDQAIVSTLDFFPPVVDDPYDYGAIAAANALSDVYAMGGTPLFAINLVAYPDGYGLEMLTEILRGGAEKVREAGAVIAGGHTVTDKEPKYGLAVTGVIHPDKIIAKGGARPGDRLILTKSLGSGTITTALKGDKTSADHVKAAVESMSRLNKTASEIARRYSVHAMTDITGYGLIGHSHEMAHLSGADFMFSFKAFQWLPGAFVYGEQEIFPGGMVRNQMYYEEWVRIEAELPEYQQSLLYDPQTSGGLLIAVPVDAAEAMLAELVAAGESAAIVGEVAVPANIGGGILIRQ